MLMSVAMEKIAVFGTETINQQIAIENNERNKLIGAVDSFIRFAPFRAPALSQLVRATVLYTMRVFFFDCLTGVVPSESQ